MKLSNKKFGKLPWRILSLFSVGFSLSIPLVANANPPAQYVESCATCHETGALNAPKTGDSATWQKLISQKGMPALINTVKVGGSQMPAGGLCSNCKDSDYRALIDYMAK